MTTTTHLMNLEANPPEADVWTMLCGAQCFAFDDETLVPELDFVSADRPEKSDCDRCKGRAILLACMRDVKHVTTTAAQEIADVQVQASL
jgi:hypothetical protein